MVEGPSDIIDNLLWWRKCLMVEGLSDIIYNVLWWRKCLNVEGPSNMIGIIVVDMIKYVMYYGGGITI